MEASGHFSPLGAYNEAADKFLLMDVARYKYPPYWADAAQLFASMGGTDLSSGSSRGYVVVAPAATAPGPKGARARSPLRILAGIVTAAFVVGALAGAAIATLVMRRRIARQASARG